MLLYKYRGLSQLSHTLDILINQRLYCAPYAELNDPFEGQFTSLVDEVEPLPLSPPGTAVIPARKVMLSVSDRWDELPLICSLSRDVRDVRLWSLYAESHKGVAIEIDFEGAESKVSEVQYLESLPDLTPRPALIKIDSKPVNVLTKKTSHWDYEAEYRILSPHKYFSIKGQIRRVLVGFRVPEELISILKAVCPPEIPLMLTKLDHEKIQVIPTHWKINVSAAEQRTARKTLDELLALGKGDSGLKKKSRRTRNKAGK